jgi:hypothetical protein
LPASDDNAARSVTFRGFSAPKLTNLSNISTTIDLTAAFLPKIVA